MPFIIETFDKSDHQQLRRQLRPAHLSFLENNKHLLLACGAKLSDDGSDADGGIYIVDINTREEADAFIARDPFFQGNLFETITVRRWRKAYIDGRCYL